MTTKDLIIENVALQCNISQVISDLVDSRLYKDSKKEAECISRMETLLVGLNQHLQCTEAFLKESKSQFINKACNYLLTHIDKDLVIYHEQSWKSLGQLVKEFKKAMEE